MTGARLAPVAPLFVPGDRADRFGKAALSGADCIIIDLEDAVAPDAKNAARAGLAAAIPGDIPVLIRINAADTVWHGDDLALCGSGLPIAGIVLPKASPDSVRATAQAGLAVFALIETATGLADARRIAASAGVAGLVFGSLDYATDLGLAHERETLYHARAELVLAARLAGLPAPIDGVTPAVRDTARLAADTAHARAMGFGGKLALHPEQIAGIRSGFAPSPEDIADARRVVATREGVALVDGRMVDAPVRLRAERILRQAEGLA